jgi:ABC-type Zn uptake system ZnuABC Zn-binding protein ZnuA
MPVRPCFRHFLLAASFAFLPSAAISAELNVVASFSILGDLATQVGGERVEVTTLVGPDSDAHVYEPRPTDARTLAAADVILANGLEFEGFLGRLIEASGTQAPVIELTTSAELLEDPDGGHYHGDVFHAGTHDPHAWQSVANVTAYVASLANAFCDLDEAGCDSYRQNADAYRADLTALGDEISRLISEIPESRRTVIVPHNAFRYFEDAYGIRFLAPAGISTEAEASAADMARIVDELRAETASAIFVENIADPRLMRRIAAETGKEIAGTLYSDALSPQDGPAPSYLAMMRHNLTTLLDALGDH